MKKIYIALLCTLGVAACGGEEQKPAQSPTTTTSSMSEPAPQPVAPPTTMPSTPSPAPMTGTDPMMAPPPDSSGMGGGKMDSMGTGSTGTMGTGSMGSSDATGLPGPNPPAAAPPSGSASSDADKMNADNKMNEPSTGKTAPTEQKKAGSDTSITAAVKASITSEKSLSASAKNLKISTTKGKVTLKGTVKSEDDKSAIESKAKGTAGVQSVDNQLIVKK